MQRLGMRRDPVHDFEHPQFRWRIPAAAYPIQACEYLTLWHEQPSRLLARYLGSNFDHFYQLSCESKTWAVDGQNRAAKILGLE